jgi:hypothetical protein
MSARDLTYDGPGAWLVRMNLLAALFALAPAIGQVFAAFAVWSSRSLGDAIMIPAVILSFAFIAIGTYPFLVCFPILFASLFGHRLLRNPDVPSPVKNTTFLCLGAALLIMLVHAVFLHLLYLHGHFR